MEKVVSQVQNQVQEAVDRLVDSGAERGMQVAVYRNGERVVDAVWTTSGIAFAVTKNRLTPDFNAATQLSQLVSDALRPR